MKSKYITIILAVIVIAGVGCFAVPKLLHKHTYSETITAEVTCEADGVKTYTCTCGDSYTESIPATGHDNTYVYNDDATTEADGTETATCTICGMTADTRTASGTKLENHTGELTEEEKIGYGLVESEPSEESNVKTTGKSVSDYTDVDLTTLDSEELNKLLNEIADQMAEEQGLGGGNTSESPAPPAQLPEGYTLGNPETDMGDDVWDGPLDSTPDGNFIN